MSRFGRAKGARAHQFPLLLIASAALTGTALLAACSAATSGSPTSSGGGAAHRAAAAAPRSAQYGAGITNAGNNGPAAAPTTAAERARLITSAQAIIYTAQLGVRVKDVTAAATAVTGVVTAVGGYVSGEQDLMPQGQGATPQITLTLKIPSAQYTQTLKTLSSAVGGRQLYLNQHTVNVTQEVADVSSRVASAQDAIKQLRALLSRAGSVGALLSVQDEINSQESNLESLLAQQNALSHETSFGTVTVTLIGHHAAIVKKHEKKRQHGFVSGLKSGWHALGLVVSWLLTALGTLLPFAIPIALIGGLIYAGRRRVGRRRSPPAADPPATA